MLRYFIAIIILTIYYPCFGIPIKQNVSLTPLASELQKLASSCDNSFLSELIKMQIEHCNISKQVETKNEYMCLMFYDINTQLCTAFRRSKLNLQENYTAKINEVQNIKTICKSAPSWQFVYKDLYPKDKSVDVIFKDEFNCARMCESDAFMSSDSNYFCKYYQWGYDVIKSQAANMIIQNREQFLPIANSTHNNASIMNSKNDNIKPSTHDSLPNSVPETVKTELSEPEVSSPDLAKETSGNQIAADISNKITEQSIQTPDVQTKGEIEKPPQKDEEEKIAKEKDSQTKDTQIKDVHVNNAESDKQLESEDDNPDQEDADDEPEYNQVDTAAKVVESDPGIDVKKSNNGFGGMPFPDKKDKNVPLVDSDHEVKTFKDRVAIESISAGENFPNPMQDSMVDGDDDSFFPFFLSTIITVVIFYIVYHNRAKLGRLFVGLLVEGRIPGRRRNSRGHAYRRLDTLEQAMSTNSAAPPSKIIY